MSHSRLFINEIALRGTNYRHKITKNPPNKFAKSKIMPTFAVG